MFDFKNHAVLVTGAGAGIGLGIAQAFHGAGARVALGDLREAGLARAADKLGRSDRVFTHTVDVRDGKSVDAFVQAAERVEQRGQRRRGVVEVARREVGRRVGDEDGRCIAAPAPVVGDPAQDRGAGDEGAVEVGPAALVPGGVEHELRVPLAVERRALRGELVGEVFPDVPVALSRWHADRRRACIFSSGSTHAQRLLFRHSSAGDLTPYLTAYFDTTTGPKAEPASYTRIAASLNIAPDDIVFVSDVPRELDAARAAGMRTRLALRPGNPPEPECRHERLFSLDEMA